MKVYSKVGSLVTLFLVSSSAFAAGSDLVPVNTVLVPKYDKTHQTLTLLKCQDPTNIKTCTSLGTRSLTSLELNVILNQNKEDTVLKVGGAVIALGLVTGGAVGAEALAGGAAEAGGAVYDIRFIAGAVGGIFAGAIGGATVDGLIAASVKAANPLTYSNRVEVAENLVKDGESGQTFAVDSKGTSESLRDVLSATQAQ